MKLADIFNDHKDQSEITINQLKFVKISLNEFNQDQGNQKGDWATNGAKF